MKKGAQKGPPPERQYTLQEAIMISRWVTQCLEGHPEWFREEGIFRLSGSKEDIDNTTKAILEKRDVSVNPHFRDVYIGVLKNVLKNSILVSKDDPDVIALSSAILSDSMQDKDKSAALKSFIQKCSDSANPDKALLAEILHNYLHVLKLAEKQEGNKMNANNLAIIFTPILIDKILQVPEIKNPMIALTFNSTVQNICVPLIAGNDYLASFKLDEKISKLTEKYTGLLGAKLAVERVLSSYDAQQAQYSRAMKELDAKYRKDEIKDPQYQAQKKELAANSSRVISAMDSEKNHLSQLEPLLSEQKAALESLKRQKRGILEARGESTEAVSSAAAPLTRTYKPITKAEERPEFFEGLNEPSSPGSTPSVLSPPLSPASSLSPSPGSTPPLSTSSSPQRSLEGSPDTSPRRRGRTPPLLLSVDSNARAPAEIEENFQEALSAAKEGKPTKVIESLVESLKVLQLPPESIGKLLYEHRAELSEYKEQLGDILSQPPKDKSNKIIVEAKPKSESTHKEYLEKIAESDEFKMCQGYIGKFEFKDQDFGPALKQFLEHGGFRLPGESQKAERILDAFGNRYYNDNKSRFPDNPRDQTKGADKVSLLAVVTIMLNTDLHNPSIKKKMTKDAFVEQVKHCDIDDKKYAEQLYNYIKKNEIAMPKAVEQQTRAAASAPVKRQ